MDGSRLRPRRILIVDDGVEFGGSLISTANLVRSLDRDRFEPIFVSATNRLLVANALKEAAPRTRVVIARRTLHHLRLNAMADWVRHLSFPSLRKPVEAFLYLVRHLLNFPYTVRLTYLMVRYRVELVQANNGLGGDEIGLAAMIGRRPRIGFFRGYWTMGRIQRNFFEPGVRKFVAVSKYIADRAVGDGIDPRKVIVATPPVIVEEVTDTDLREVRERHGLSPGQPLFGIFGRVVPWKGQLEFLRAARLVLERVPDARALVVGDASDGDHAYMDRLLAFTREHGLGDRVIFAGYREDVATYYTLLDVVVHASIEPEPSGRVIFEAMSYGTPVVASHLGGPREFVEDGEDGFIVDPTDAERLAERVLLLLTDPELRESMGAKGRKKMLSRFGPEPYARRVEAVYDEVLGGPPS